MWHEHVSGLHACPAGSSKPDPTPKDPVDSDDSSGAEGGEERKEYSGEIEIPNLSEENDVEEIDVCIKAESQGGKV